MSSISDFLYYVPIFSDLSQETIDEIVKVGTTKTYGKDNIILLEEEEGSALFVILKGKVKIIRTSGDGREVILTIMGEYDFFGEMSVLDGLKRSATAVAMENTEIFIIQRDEFLELLKKYAEIALALLQEFTKRLRTSDMQIKSLSLKDAEGKVATVLLQLADDIGRIKSGIVEIDRLPLQQDLANMAGTSRETISRTLQSFARKGWIEMVGSKLKILNYEKFKETFIYH